MVELEIINGQIFRKRRVISPERLDVLIQKAKETRDASEASKLESAQKYTDDVLEYNSLVSFKAAEVSK